MHLSCTGRTGVRGTLTSWPHAQDVSKTPKRNPSGHWLCTGIGTKTPGIDATSLKPHAAAENRSPLQDANFCCSQALRSTQQDNDIVHFQHQVGIRGKLALTDATNRLYLHANSIQREGRQELSNTACSG